METREQQTKREYLASFIVAYVISIKALNQLLGTILGRTDGIMTISLLCICALIALHFFISEKGSMNLNKKSLLFVYYVLSIIVVYKYAYRYSSTSYEELFAFVMIPLYLSFYKIDTEKVLKYIIVFSMLVLPFAGSFFHSSSTNAFETIGMTTSYNTLIFVVAAALHFWYYKREASPIMWVGYGINIYYFIKVLTLGSRGPVIALVVLFVLLILHKFDKDGKMGKHAFKKIFITIAVGIAVVYVVDNLEDVLRSLDEWLKTMGIEINSISKSIQKLEQGDFSNGRDAILKFTKKGIEEHYLIGNGISTMFYNSNYAIAYPHNIFYQLWYDLGIIVSIPMFYLIIKSTKKTFFDSSLSKGHAVLLIFLYTLAIPRLCVSSQLWVDISFWFLMTHSITPNIYTDEYEENEEEL